VSGGIPAVFTHTVEADILSVNIEPAVQYEIVQQLYAHVGISAGLLMTTQYSQIEVITVPESGTFPNGERSRNEVTDEPIPGASSVVAGLVAGISYDLPLNRDQSVFISPELYYNYGLTNLVDGLDWSVNQVRFGVAVKWMPKAAETPTEPEQPLQQELRDTTRTPIAAVDDAPFNVFLQASVVTDTGVSGKEFVVTVEDFTSVSMTPLLNYLFFDRGSAVIPDRYTQTSTLDTESFDESAINPEDKLNVYYNVLNIIGHRLKVHKDARITLVGCNANVAEEENNTLLSRQRAVTVRDYLNRVWGIDTARVEIVARNLPALAANSSSKDGMQENSRVEIVSDNELITAPLSTTGIVRNATPPYVTFTLRVDSPIAVTSWKLETYAGDRAFKAWTDSGSPPANIEWRLNPNTEPSLDFSIPIVCRLTVVNQQGSMQQAFDSIPVKQVTLAQKRAVNSADREINRFGLILFGVRSSSISQDNAFILDNIKTYIKPESKVTITGYTDRSGDAAYNQELATERARSTARYLGIDVNGMNVKGIGNANTFDADLPEGRLYTRTVEIIVETPIEK